MPPRDKCVRNFARDAPAPSVYGLRRRSASVSFSVPLADNRMSRAEIHSTSEIIKLSKCVTLSALVQSATWPGSEKVESCAA